MNPENIIHYQDGVASNKINEELLNTLEKTGSLKEGNVDFVGFVWADKNPAVFWPKGMKIHERDFEKWRQNLLLIINTLRRCKKENQSVFFSSGENIENVSPLEIEILEDYKLNGLYDSKSRIASRSMSGKINWKKTILYSELFSSDDNSPVYLNPYVIKNISDNNIIKQIHSFIVSESDKRLGWLIAKEGNSVAPECRDKKLKLEINTAISYVRKELTRQFSEKKIMQLKLMEQFLKSFQGKINNTYRDFWGTSSFHIVWESLCKHYYKDQHNDVSGVIPSYIYAEEKVSRSSKNKPLPDIIIFEGDKLAVIDAKYYDFRKTQPGWADMVKQFFYVKAYQNFKGYKKINNYFVVPQVDLDGPEKIAVLREDNNQRLDDEFNPIKIIYLDMIVMMENYIRRKIGTIERKQALEG